MIKIQKQQNSYNAAQNIQSLRQDDKNAVSAIRAASASELTEYEKSKLSRIEDSAQQNKIEVIRVNGARIPTDANTKTVNINVGDLAFKSAVTSSDIDSNELFFIKCELD